MSKMKPADDEGEDEEGEGKAQGQKDKEQQQGASKVHKKRRESSSRQKDQYDDPVMPSVMMSKMGLGLTKQYGQ